MKVFLTAKHWHLFLLYLVIPMMVHLYYMSTIITEGPEALFSSMMYYGPVIFILMLGTLFGWLYTVGISLQSRLPEGVKMPVVRFKLFLFIPLVYMTGALTFFFWLIAQFTSGATITPTFLFGTIAVLLPIHFFSVFCIFHSFWFVAKSLKSVELQKDVTISDYAGEFALIWFFFIGVWIIQPRINNMFAENPE
jgi:hypothetical protein